MDGWVGRLAYLYVCVCARKNGGWIIAVHRIENKSYLVERKKIEGSAET